MAEIKEAMKLGDADDNGELDFEEFVALIAKVSPATTGGRSTDTTTLVAGVAGSTFPFSLVAEGYRITQLIDSFDPHAKPGMKQRQHSFGRAPRAAVASPRTAERANASPNEGDPSPITCTQPHAAKSIPRPRIPNGTLATTHTFAPGSARSPRGVHVDPRGADPMPRPRLTLRPQSRPLPLPPVPQTPRPATADVGGRGGKRRERQSASGGARVGGISAFPYGVNKLELAANSPRAQHLSRSAR